MELDCSKSSPRDRVQTDSPKKGTAVNGEVHLMDAVKSKPQSSPLPCIDSSKDLRNKDEIYFDSQPWIDSDNEDFVSVNGDSTPSWEKSPIIQNRSTENSPSERSILVNNSLNSTPEPTSMDMKKQLIEFFHDKSSDDDSDNADKSFKVAVEAKPMIISSRSPKSTNRSTCGSIANSVCNSRTTVNRGSNTGTEKSTQSSRCCLPNLVKSLGFSERKKRQT